MTRSIKSKTKPKHPLSPAPAPRASLESVIINNELRNRPPRPRDTAGENRALLSLARSMKSSPKSLLQDLVDLTLDLCQAHSAGISILEEENGRQIFRWHAIAGQWSHFHGGTIARDLSPCGAVLARNTSLLFSDPGRHYQFPSDFKPTVAEVLLIPFHRAGRPVGTLWVVAHDKTRRFDAEDERLLSTLSKYAATAYALLIKAGSAKVQSPPRPQATSSP